MRIVYYSLPSFLDLDSHQVKVLSSKVELHIVIEVSPFAWKYNILGLPLPPWGPGFYDARDFLRENLPKAAMKYYEGASGIYFSVYPSGFKLSSLKTLWLTQKKIADINPDILHFDGESIRAASWSSLVNIPLVLNVHEPKTTAGVWQQGLGLAKSILIPKAKVIITHSDECMQDLIKYWHIPPARIKKIPLGPFDILKAWAQSLPVEVSKKRKMVFMWGWLNQRKGVDILVDAAPLIAQEIADVDIVIAGKPSGGYNPPAPTQLPNNGFMNIITGHLKYNDLARLLSDATITTMPYRHARQSGVILTAYGLKKPVVASDIKALREQVRDNYTGLLVKPEDPVALANGIISLLKNDQLIAEMSKNINTFCEENISWDAFGAQVNDVYTSMLR